MKALLTITAVLEAATGVAILVVPSVVCTILLGAPLEAAAAQAVARIAGAALLSLGIACWVVRRDAGGCAARGMVVAMLVYNCGVVVILVCGAMYGGLRGIGLWPASILHTAFAVWCLVCLASRRTVPPSSVAPRSK